MTRQELLTKINFTKEMVEYDKEYIRKLKARKDQCLDMGLYSLADKYINVINRKEEALFKNIRRIYELEEKLYEASINWYRIIDDDEIVDIVIKDGSISGTRLG